MYLLNSINRYYACLAISVLVANKELEAEVKDSGTLELVLPFISSHTPSEFARMDLSHRHGRSRGWLKRLLSLLSSKRVEAQALAAFHFAMEAGIKLEQDKKEVILMDDKIMYSLVLIKIQFIDANKLGCQKLQLSFCQY